MANKKQLLAMAAIGCAALAVETTPQVSRAATPSGSNLAPYFIGDDYFYNYDFTDPQVTGSDNDWPITMIFTNDASIDLVKNEIYWSTAWKFSNTPWDSTMYELLSDGSNGGPGGTTGGGTAIWDTDAGTKSPDWTAGCASNEDTTFTHMRLYADAPSVGGDDHLYNLTWGFCVVGSTHFDYNECPLASGPRSSGFSEDAETAMINRAMQQNIDKHLNLQIFPGAIALGNAEPFRVEGTHVWQSDGRATMVYMPAAPTPPPGPTPVPVPPPCSGKC